MNELDTTQLRAWADKDERYGFTDSAAERRAAADTIDALRAERDALRDRLHHVEHWTVSEAAWKNITDGLVSARVRADAAEAALAERDRIIAEAPHESTCGALDEPCHCWKSRIEETR